jgi:16S rRNA (cytosine1402-N4)-methyltransferase
MEFKHTSVLLEECIEYLNIKKDGIYVDGTLGGAGHSIEICKKLSNEGMLIGIDQDETAIKVASERLEPFSHLTKIVRSNFENFESVLNSLQIEYVDGILLDLGVSSYQIDTAERGFSYMKDAELDMRMDQRSEKTAYHIVNDYSLAALTNVLKIYGEERFAKNIANNIVKARAESPITTTGQLVSIIERSIPGKYKAKGGHPAKRTFQGIRIELNRELEVLETTLNTMIQRLNNEGRLCIITFHSLEDRIVKHIFKENENPCTCPSEFPICVCGKKPRGVVITRKPILPKDEEIKNNSRSVSAKLRVFEKRVGDMDE